MKSSKNKRSPTSAPPRSKSVSSTSRSSGARTVSTTAFHSDWSEFIGLLLHHRVRFLVVGGHAVAVHGIPRATFVLDVLVEPSVTNATRLGEALRAFGFPALSAKAGYFALPQRMAALGNVPLRIDVMSSIDGVSFPEAWRGKVVERLADLEVPFLGRAALLKNKTAAGRPKDLADVAAIQALRPRRR